MIVKNGHKLFGKVQLTDFRGAIIPSVFYFNTKTKRVKMFVTGHFEAAKPGMVTTIVSGRDWFSKGNKPMVVSFVLKGAKLIDKVTKKEIK